MQRDPPVQITKQRVKARIARLSPNDGRGTQPESTLPYIHLLRLGHETGDAESLHSLFPNLAARDTVKPLGPDPCSRIDPDSRTGIKQ